MKNYQNIKAYLAFAGETRPNVVRSQIRKHVLSNNFLKFRYSENKLNLSEVLVLAYGSLIISCKDITEKNVLYICTVVYTHTHTHIDKKVKEVVLLG